MHELDDLYVVDSSSFVSSSAVNPTLTISADAIRVGEHLVERLGARLPAQRGTTEPVTRWSGAGSWRVRRC